jgi:hypothetical protein
MGLDHAVQLRADGSAEAISNRGSSERRLATRFVKTRDGKPIFTEPEPNQAALDSAYSQRRAPIRLAKSREGGLVPTDRGGRREAVINELGPVLEAHGIPLSSRERRGPRPTVPVKRLIAEINELITEGMMVSIAFQTIADQYFMSAKYVQDTYYAHRNDERTKPEDPIDRTKELLNRELRGEKLVETLRVISYRQGTSSGTVLKRLAEQLGWSADEVRDRLEGGWKWTSRHDPSKPDGGHWTRLNDLTNE